MQNYKINIKDLLVNLSLLIYSLIILIRPYLIRTLGNKGVLAFFVVSILLLFTCILIFNKLRVNNYAYILLCTFMSVPFFYKNAYIQDGYYNFLFYFIGSVIFCLILSSIKLSEKNIIYIMKIFLAFALITSLVTWFSLIFPQSYDSIFISLLPLEEQQIVRTDFWQLGMKMGLSNHYSRNAFFLVLGIISCIIMQFKSKKNKYNIYILLFVVTMLLIGKRGHFLFLIAALFIAYFIYEKMSIKKIMNIVKYILFLIILVILAIIFIPGTSNMIERILNTSGGDISTGRFELYEMAWSLFANNSYKPIGWGQFAKSTNYFFAGVHNDYLQLLCETGILGLGLILFSNIYILVKTIGIVRKNNEDAISFGILIYQVFFLIYSFTGLPHYDTETYMVYFIFTCFIWNNFWYKEKKYVK